VTVAFDVPYGLTYQQLELEPGTVAKLDRERTRTLEQLLAGLRGDLVPLDPDEVARVFHAAAILHSKMLATEPYRYEPGVLLWACLDTAITWERG
jgi:hypothetical protein